ncbi:MAG: small subunit ribosomal protein S7 [Microgenomates group bacterium LiPW_16]|nr:MAG: small subunit ribosomal protein S7 [Microgenomates group bacterium LiPW_16]
MRTGPAKKRKIEVDPLFGSVLVTRLTNRVMKAGKKGVAQKLVYSAFEEIKKKGQEPLKVLEDAVANVSPRMEVRPRRVGGASYQIPREVRGDRRFSLAIRWLITAAKNRSSKEFRSFDQKLAAELLDASQGQGEAIKKRNQIHKMAEANRAFAHFRW